MAAAIILLAIVAAATAGFVLAYSALGFGVLASAAIGYLGGSLTALVFVVILLLTTKSKEKAKGYMQRDGRITQKQPRS